MGPDDMINSALNKGKDDETSSEYIEDETNKGELPKSNIQVQHGVVIPLPFTTLSTRTVLSLKECYMVLFEEFLTYKIVGNYESENDLEMTQCLMVITGGQE